MYPPETEVSVAAISALLTPPFKGTGTPKIENLNLTVLNFEKYLRGSGSCGKCRELTLRQLLRH